MNDNHALHPLWNENRPLAEQLRNRIEAAHARGDGNYNLGGMEIGDAGMSYIAHYLQPYNDVKILALSTVGITDESAADIVKIARNSPQLCSLQLENNHFTGKGMEVLAEGLQSSPMLMLFDIRSNPLSVSGGEPLAALLAKPSLENFTAVGCQLGDEGMRPISAAIGRSHTIEKVNLGDNGVSLEGCHDYIKAVSRNRSLIYAAFSQTADNDERKEYLTKAYAEVLNPNLLNVFPVNSNNRPKLLQNKSDVDGLPPHLAGDLQDIPHGTLKYIDARANAIFSLPCTFLIPDSRETRNETYVRYETFMRALPKLPKADADFVPALFTTDDKGFTPLDNPRINRTGSALLDALETLETPLNMDLLTKTTTRGGSIIEALAGAMDTDALIGALNNKGIKLGAGHLVASNGLPTQTLHNIIDKGQGAALFTADNWMGKSKAEMQKVYEALPSAQRKEVGLHALQTQMRPSSQQGLGR